MDEQTYTLVLNGMPFREFIVFYLWAILGALLFFLRSLYTAIKTDVNTPYTFQWRYFTKGLIRVIVTVVTLAVVIIFWENIAQFIFTSDDPVELTGWSAFLLGTLNDRVMSVVLSGGDDVGKYIKKKVSA